MIDLMSDVAFTSWFSTVDIFENIQNDEGVLSKEWYGFFGLLGENFDAEGKPLGTYYQKKAYHAMQTLCALFADKIKRIHLPMEFLCLDNSLTGGHDMDLRRADAGAFCQGFEAQNGSRCFAYWKAENILTTDLEASTTLRFIGQEGEIHLIDPYDGNVYAIDPARIKREEGVLTLMNMPLKDYPLLITFGDFAQIEQ